MIEKKIYSTEICSQAYAVDRILKKYSYECQKSIKRIVERYNEIYDGKDINV